ncbi:adenine nucleotide alpha hydrolases-like superfamily protein [Tasmannia lanceolata]|uniref:adenine nucleotide alpha hydrolases-like superfamily protein n=1 Tax=Tasmannia lanceolata TaxID=3420 RepID=UPI0040632AAD
MEQEGSREMQMEGLHMNENGLALRKRVMVVIDQSTSAKNAMIWALTHMTNKGDLLTLLQIIPPHRSQRNSLFADSSPHLANSLGSLCKSCKPEVEVEALVIQGPKLLTVISQVKKLEASVLVLGQKKSSLINCFLRSRNEDLVEQCINNAECLTLAVRKQKRGMGGYLISTRWQKNFWLLA